MNFLGVKIYGDKVIWFIFILIIFSISPLSIYSSSTLMSLSYFIIKHIGLSFVGIVVVYFIHKIPTKYFGAFSIIMIPIIAVLLFYTLTLGTTIDGESSSRWIKIPILGITFQPSLFGILIILIYTSRYISSKKNDNVSFWTFFKELVLPVGLILLLILPSNFSTAFMGFTMFLTLLFVGNVRFKYFFNILLINLSFSILFILLIKAFPDKIPNRLSTWGNRIETFLEDGERYDYQIEKSKAAISQGGFFGLGPGKSIQKHFLPQSDTDFIFSIIIEEYGFLGAFVTVFLYLFLFFRVLILVSKSNKKSNKLLATASLLPIIFSSFINMGVATNILPVTGQNLPFISSGGTSILTYSLCIGIILSVSRETNMQKSSIK